MGIDCLKGKVTIITGASSGIGAALARAFSNEGALVVLAARRIGKLEKAARACHGDTLAVKCDATSADERQRLVDEAVERFGRVDILVNNAGIGLYGDIEATKESDLRRLFEVNVFAVFLLTKLVLSVMRKQGSGLILNIGSIGGLIAHSDKVTAYVASKHAVVGFTRGLQRDLHGTGIDAKVVCPQLVDTGFYQASVGAREMEGLLEKVKGRMDTVDQVVEGVMRGIFSDRLVILPTEKSERAYERFRDV